MAKYERIADDLRNRIRDGTFHPGDQLPNEQTLLAEHRVSLPVVRQALDLLEAEGLVDRIHGRGTYVRRPRQRVRRSPERYQWEKDRVRLSDAQRRRTGATEKDTGLTMEDLEFHTKYETVPADDDLSREFQVPVGAKLLRRTYSAKSRHEDTSLHLITSYLIFDIAAENPALLDAQNEPWPGGTQHQLSTIGIELDRIIDKVTARPPTPEEVEALRLKPGTAVLVLRKTSVDINDCVAEVSDVILPGDRTEFVYTTKLKRWKNDKTERSQ